MFKRGYPDEIRKFITNQAKPSTFARMFWNNLLAGGRSEGNDLQVGFIVIDLKESEVQLMLPLEDRIGLKSKLEPLVKDLKARYSL